MQDPTEKLLATMEAAAHSARLAYPSADNIDKGVWNDDYVPVNPVSYLKACCPFNVLSLIHTLKKLQNDFTTVQQSLGKQNVQLQAVLFDIADIIIEERNGVIRPDPPIPEAEKYPQRELTDLRIEVLRILRDRATIRAKALELSSKVIQFLGPAVAQMEAEQKDKTT